jgi:menaquinone-dependent protoporphyrinogen IX oxidase
MKILILYASRRGTIRQMAELIGSSLNDYQVDLKKAGNISVQELKGRSENLGGRSERSPIQ